MFRDSEETVAVNLATMTRPILRNKRRSPGPDLADALVLGEDIVEHTQG